MICLGIDPGTLKPGFCVLSLSSEARASCKILSAGCLVLKAKDPLPMRLIQIYDFFENMIVTCSVSSLAIETPFLGKNAQNFLKLGYVRGILYLLAQRKGLEILEFTPRQVKLAVSGYGGADKEMVARSLSKLFPVFDPSAVEMFDITDAIAVAFCGIMSLK